MPAQSPQPAKPIVTLASANSADKPVQLASLGDDSNHITGSDALPGVRKTALFEIKRKSGLDDDSDVDLQEDEDWRPAAIRLASAAGLARLAPNGLLKQTESVDVACLKPSLVRVLKAVEPRYGRKMIVTSGYRRPGAQQPRTQCEELNAHVLRRRRRAGAGRGQMGACQFFRAMPGRGGVSTCCHTESVHVDVGPERDWNWRCRRRGLSA